VETAPARALAPDPDVPPFRLFSPADWTSIFGNPDTAGTEQDQVLLQRLGQVLLATASDPRHEEMTWRELFDQYARRTLGVPMAPEIWVDAAWLADEGFSLDDVLPTWAAQDSVAAATAVLSAARLVMVLHNDIVLLTSLDGLARQPLTAEATSHPCVAVARPNSWLSNKSESAQTIPPPDVVPLEAWVGAPAYPEPPWVGHRNAMRSGVAGRAWRVCELPVGDAGQCALTVEHTKSLWVAGWSLLLAVTGIIGGWGRRLRRYLCPLLVATAVLALVVPSELVPITSSLFRECCWGSRWPASDN